MSLTRIEWERMWESIKHVEKLLSMPFTETIIKKNYPNSIAGIYNEINKIKEMIQSVIGQME